MGEGGAPARAAGAASQSTPKLWYRRLHPGPAAAGGRAARA